VQCQDLWRIAAQGEQREPSPDHLIGAKEPEDFNKKHIDAPPETTNKTWYKI
jgi:hypothetical protein